MFKVLLRERASQICVTNPRYSTSIKEKKWGRREINLISIGFQIHSSLFSPLSHDSTVSVGERHCQKLYTKQTHGTALELV